MASTRASEPWVAVSMTVTEADVELASFALLRAGAEGIVEYHAGLHFGEDGPLLSGDPADWKPELPASPDGLVRLSGYLPAGGPEELLGHLDRIRDGLLDLGVNASDLRVDAVPEEDWNATWKAGWRPFGLSPRVWVIPSWETETAPPRGMAVLRIDPGMAFGTGSHATTSGCAALLDELLAEDASRSVLDVGTGTGILAMLADQLGAGPILAVDIDPDAVATARDNVLRNGLENITIREGSADAVDGTFDIVVANLLAPVITRLAEPLTARVGPRGGLLWSGVLTSQEAAVADALAARGLGTRRRIEREGWVAIWSVRGTP